MNKNLIYMTFFLVAFSFFIPVKKEEDNKKMQILSTTVMLDSLVKEIVHENFTTLLLMEGEIDPHSYQMRKGDKEKIENAKIIFANGLSLEHNPSLYYHLTSKEAIFLGDRILQECPESIISNDGEIDPHMWMDLSIMQRVCEMICTEVIAMDPDRADFYNKNTKALKERMEVLDKKILSMMENVPEECRYLVSSHDAFNYFVRRYFISDQTCRLFSMQGLSTESEISLKRIKQVVDFIKERSISTIFFESNLPKDSIWKVMEICKNFGLDIKISEDPLYGDTLGGMTYLEMIEYDAEVIAKNLIKENKYAKR